MTSVPDAPPAPDRRADASMTLLTEMLQRPLDPGYAAAAEARAERGLTPATGAGSWRFAVALLVAGLLLGVGATTLGAASTSRSEARADLITSIEAGRKSGEEKAAQIAALNAELAALDAAALQGTSGDAARLKDLSVVTGASAVEGPGLVITLDDAPELSDPATKADPRMSGRNQDGIVRARDLQIVTNSLWAAGAEAIMINGQRLTTTTAIRFAGEALIVNYRPLTRPYVITAIGDPGSLPGVFANGDGGSYLATLSGSFGIRERIETVKSATLPASSSVLTRVAGPLGSGDESASRGSKPRAPRGSGLPLPGSSPDTGGAP
ncbi:MAG TPA: DUF881 domain-containing protein [Phycicoccus sp.]|nr:DUF881 domain-containing protein [Phycicoccus sp.]HRA44558.1 DUF881 domain-containing protein [Phycicoccus sp.]